MAHGHQNTSGSDPRTSVSARVAGNESARCEKTWPPQPRRGRCYITARSNALRRTAPDGDYCTRAGVYALPFLRYQRERSNTKRVRSHIPRTELQTMRGPCRTLGSTRMKRLVVVG